MPGLEDLPPDTLANLARKYLGSGDLVCLAQCGSAMRASVYRNEVLWHGLHEEMYPVVHKTWRSVEPSWRSAFLRTGLLARQCRTVQPATRHWSIDTNPITLARIYPTCKEGRLVLTAQQSVLELQSWPAQQSWQCFGHTARVTCGQVLPGAGHGGHGKISILSAAADQTLRLWSAANAVHSMDLDGLMESCSLVEPSMTLLTPIRTLRGHQEGITSMELISGSSGVTIAATGAKDRTVRLWGLAPLLPSPTHKPQIAVLRGHGAPVTSLAAIGQQLVSGSLDGRVLLWDVWAAACSAHVKCAAAVSHVLPWDEHSVLAASRGAVQLIDLRTARCCAAARQPASAQQVYCLARHEAGVAAGGADAARVWDFRMLDAAGAAVERLVLAGHAGPVDSIHADQAKLVTCTSAFGESPCRVWCPQTGECMAALDSEPAPAPGGDSDGRDDHAGWAGVTALACRRSLLLTGNSDGGVCERDFAWGQLPLERQEAVAVPSRFWQGAV